MRIVMLKARMGNIWPGHCLRSGKSYSLSRVFDGTDKIVLTSSPCQVNYMAWPLNDVINTGSPPSELLEHRTKSRF